MPARSVAKRQGVFGGDRPRFRSCGYRFVRGPFVELASASVATLILIAFSANACGPLGKVSSDRSREERLVLSSIPAVGYFGADDRVLSESMKEKMAVARRRSVLWAESRPGQARARTNCWPSGRYGAYCVVRRSSERYVLPCPTWSSPPADCDMSRTAKRETWNQRLGGDEK